MDEKDNKDRKDKKQEIMNFIFEGIFKSGDTDLASVSIDHMVFVQDLDSIKKEKFNLSYNEIDKYIKINEEGWEPLECNVELFNNSKNTSRYEISMKFKKIQILKFFQQRNH